MDFLSKEEKLKLWKLWPDCIQLCMYILALQEYQLHNFAGLLWAQEHNVSVSYSAFVVLRRIIRALENCGLLHGCILNQPLIEIHCRKSTAMTSLVQQSQSVLGTGKLLLNVIC